MRATLIAVTVLVAICAFRAHAQEEGVPLVAPKSDQVVPEAAGDGKTSQLLGAKLSFDHKHPTKPQSRHHGSGDSAASISQFDGYHAAGLCCACIGLILAAGGGIGGGGILVPIYILIMRFSARYGIPLSNVTILGGALANNAFNMQKRHPDKNVNRPVIDFDLVLLMEPPTIAGAVIGSILNKILPEWIITTLLVLVLGATALRTWQSAEKQSAKEAAALEAAAAAGEDKALIQKEAAGGPGGPSGDAGSDGPSGGSGSATVDEAAIAGSDAEPTGMWKYLLEDNGEQFPLWKLGAITGCFLLVVATNILKLHATTCGSAGYWVLMMTPVFLTVGMMLAVRVYLLKKSALKQARGEELIEGDVNWDNRTTITYPALCTLSGLFAGMFGIGGGIVKGPLMIEMGVLPEVSAATAAFMIFYTASSATVTYASFGTVIWSFAGVLFALGLFCTAIGQYAVNAYIKQTGRASIIVYIICGIVGLSTLLMGYESGLLAYNDISAGKAGWGTLCPK